MLKCISLSFFMGFRSETLQPFTILSRGLLYFFGLIGGLLGVVNLSSVRVDPVLRCFI